MVDTIDLSWSDIEKKADDCAYWADKMPRKQEHLRLFGIPRGGIFAVQAVQMALLRRGSKSELTVDAADADILIDDIRDSGATLTKWHEQYPHTYSFTLIDKFGPDTDLRGKYIRFPWEIMLNEEGPTENVRRLIEYIGDDPNREGLKETPDRVIRSYATLFGGYKQKPEDVMKVFEDGACDEMVILKGIEFWSCCEHHMLPFFGKAHVAYIPKGKVIGVSKLARILEIYSRRLQIQERIGQQITDCIMTYLQPKGAACVLEASHSCMTCRGVQKQNSIMVTSSLHGSFQEDPRTRAEFFSMIKG